MKLNLLIIISLLFCFSEVIHAASIKAGKELFTKVCSRCHLVNHEYKFAPGLAAITERRDTDWINLFLQNPREMIRNDEYASTLKENNPYGLVMPKFPEMQDIEKRADIIEYLKTLK